MCSWLRRKRFLAWCLVFTAAGLGAAGAEEPKDAGPFRYDARGKRDPFLPLVKNGQLVNVGGSAALGGRPALYGILWDPAGESLALINDAEAKVGDVVNGYRVAEIRRDAVVLTVEGGEPLVLQLDFEAPQKSSSGDRNGR